VKVISAVALIAVLVLIPISSFLSRPESLRSTVLDLGRESAHFLEFPDGRTILVNTGAATRESAREVIHPFLKSEGVNAVDTIILTKLDEMHCGGVEYIMHRHRVSEVVIPGSDDSAYAGQITRMLERRGVELTQIAEGDIHQVRSGSDVTVKSVPEDGDESAGQPLLVTWVEHGDTVLLLAGAAGADGPVCTVMEQNAGSNAILVVDETGTLLEQVRTHKDTVRPALVVLSTHSSQRGHSAPPEARQKLEGLCTLMWTGRCGAVTIDLRDEGFEVRSMLPCGP
jgi:competence protein ComEC